MLDKKEILLVYLAFGRNNRLVSKCRAFRTEKAKLKFAAKLKGSVKFYKIIY